MTALSESTPRLLPVVREGAALRRTVAAWREAGLTVAFVPTMGALHDGHVSLVRLGLARADRVVVSVFVNPTQFGPTEDFAAYPRQEEEDAAKLLRAGAHLLYAPEVSGMYPPGFATTIRVDGVSQGLCGALRPGHFEGVATVVTKLLLRVAPDMAIFGEKDYQQLQVIRRLVQDLDLPVEVIAGPTVREPDGLALSSRNAYLSAEERARAPLLYRTLTTLATRLRTGCAADPLLAAARQKVLEGGFSSIDYLDLRDETSLTALNRVSCPGSARLLAAAKLGRTRLIDNIRV